MLRVFGKPAVPVPQPDGELVDYLVEGVPPSGRAVRSWRLTSPKGEVYTVDEHPGFWRCTCPAFTRYTRHGCAYQVGNQMVCKHVLGMAAEVGCEIGGTESHSREAGDPRADPGLADANGGAPLVRHQRDASG